MPIISRKRINIAQCSRFFIIGIVTALWYNQEKLFSGDVMSNTMFEYVCPKCGKALQIPAELQEFSCMYCGERLSKQSFVPQASSDGIAAREYYEAHVIEVISNHFGIDRKVTNAEYEDAFALYKKENAETFRMLDEAVRAGALTAEEAANCFLDRLEQLWDTDTSRKMRRSTMIDTDKFVIAVFLVPMVRELKLSVSEDFCEKLQKNWCVRHPKSPFYLGTYEEMTAGFQKKLLGLCFITTAVCQQEGKGDNCEELTAFRAFRDGFLRSCPDGEALIREYYNIAPGIVMHIDLDRDSEQIYRRLRTDYLQPCYEDIQNGRLHQCRERYIRMVRNLERKYLC